MAASWTVALVGSVVVLAAGRGVAQTPPPAATPTPTQETTPAPALAGKFSLSVDREDVAAVLKRLASEAAVSIAFVGEIKGPVTLALRNASIEQAISLIAAAAGLSVQKVDAAYLIRAGGTEIQPGRAEAIYRVQHVRADRLVEMLKAAYDPARLKAVIGPDEYYSPTLGYKPPSTSSYAAVTSAASSSSSSPSPEAAAPAAGPGVHEILLIGDAAAVTSALALCKTIDHRRRQVRISAKITDLDVEAFRQLGIKWTTPEIKVSEQLQSGTAAAEQQKQRPVFTIGRFFRDPFLLEAAIVALEQDGRSTLLATPSLTILDGDKGYILIGERHLYPKLVSIASPSTPIFDTSEVTVGIRLDVAVEMTDSDEMVLTLYPQVSAITGLLETGFGAYPQISTREQQTTIRARAGETIVIGGLMKEGENIKVRGVPGLSRIPGLGELFKFRDKSRVKTELVIMITPEIIDDAAPGGDAAKAAAPPKG
jgi:type II secretory pathway component GspD/PulD (secretin)